MLDLAICTSILKNIKKFLSHTAQTPKIQFSLPMPPDRVWKKMKSPSSSSSSSAQCWNWLELPRDLTVSILQRLGTIEILETAQKVCMLWRNLCKDPSMWSYIDMRNLGELDDMNYDLQMMCIHAIDLTYKISTSTTSVATTSSPLHHPKVLSFFFTLDFFIINI